jgi:transposase
VRAAAQAWPDGVGIPVRNVPAVLRLLSGVPLTQGALTQDALRRAAGTVGGAYAQWRAAVPIAPVVHPDDTGGRGGAAPAHRMACETDTGTVDHRRPRHRHDAVQEVMPGDSPGVMVTDRGRSAEAQAFANVRQPTCVAHLQRSSSDALATKTGRARDFGEGRKALRQEAGQLWHASRQRPVPDGPTAAQALPEERTSQRRDRRLRDPDPQRRLHALGWHHDRGHRVRCREDPRIEPTHHRAARAWRPAVSARNVSQCSQNGRGTHAFAAFTSVVRTLTQQGIDSRVEGLSHLFRSPSLQDVPPCACVTISPANQCRFEGAELQLAVDW